MKHKNYNSEIKERVAAMHVFIYIFMKLFMYFIDVARESLLYSIYLFNEERQVESLGNVELHSVEDVFLVPSNFEEQCHKHR